MRIEIALGQSVLHATLNETAAARDFASMLPLRLSLRDFHSTEKIADLPARLSTNGAAAGTAASAGLLAYYSPWGNLAIFYRDFGYSEGLIALGHIDSPLNPLLDAKDDSIVVIATAK